jgi:hypothetical protein
MKRCHRLSSAKCLSYQFTTRRNPICGAPFWDLVAHLACATHIKPQVSFICGACPCAPRIGVIPVAHPSTCATHSLCGAPKGGAPRIGCATDMFSILFFSKIQQKYIVYSRKYIVYSRNAKVYTSVTHEFTEIHQYKVKCRKTSI